MITTINQLCKEISAILLMIFLAQVASGQDAMPAQKSDARYRVRNIIWYTPGGAKEINGLAVGFQAHNFASDKENKLLKVNGINIDIGILAIISVPAITGAQFRFGDKRVDEELFDTGSPETSINGISISFGGELSTGFNGIGVNAGVVYAPYINGVCITGLVSASGTFRGIVVGGLSNVAIRGVGLQIGLINYCRHLKGIQLGLWNKSGKRGLPFINWGI